jgi:hypothetical protein
LSLSLQLVADLQQGVSDFGLIQSRCDFQRLLNTILRADYQSIGRDNALLSQRGHFLDAGLRLLHEQFHFRGGVGGEKQLRFFSQQFDLVQGFCRQVILCGGNGGVASK